MVYDFTYRRDNGCSTAQTTLCEILDFLESNRTLLNLQTQVIFGNNHQGTTGDRRQDAVGLRSYHFVIFGHEQEVCTTGLLDISTGSCIQVHILIKTLLMSIYDSM